MHTAVPLPGDVIWIRQRRWRVERASVGRGIVRLDVQNRTGRITFLGPFDRATTRSRTRRPSRVRPQQAIARLASLVARTCAVSVTATALDARVQILRHQLEPLLALLSGHRRVLIADEVGLGKTIQAGLILAELRQRTAAFRAMVVAPASLRDQWMAELSERFGLQVHVADRAGIDHVGRLSPFGENAWQRAGIWLVSPDYLKQQHVLRGLPATAWDLVVIDEAHEACGASDRHDACDDVAQCSRRLVLLTATPHNGDEARYSRLLNMGKLPGLGEEMLVFRRTRADLALSVRRRVRWKTVTLSTGESRLLDALRGYERAVLDAGSDTPQVGRLLLLSVFRKRALSTTAALAASLARRLAWVSGVAPEPSDEWLQPRLEFEPPADELGLEDQRALSADSGLPASHEVAWLRRLRSLADDVEQSESKLRHLAGLLTRSSEPVVIFTEFRDSLEVIARRLRPLRLVAVLHGSQSMRERRRELQRFLSGEASTLIATDVAGQGLNLQARCRWVISLELPWNPARLEQRAGRVDRIGQTRDVHMTVLVARHAAERTLLTSLARRALTARQSLGDSTLRDMAPPAALAIAATLLTGTPLPAGPDEGQLSPASGCCTRFARRAAALARLLTGKRRLASRWRGSEIDRRPVWTCARRLGGLTAAGGGTMAILSVPMLDAGATVVERQLVAVRFMPALNRKGPHLVALLVSVASARLEARRRRLEAHAGRSARAAAEIETALAHHLRRRSQPGEVQAGLFSQRMKREFESAHAELAQFDRDLAQRASSLARTTSIEIGRPSLELLVVE